MPSKCSTCQNHIHLISDWEGDKSVEFCKIVQGYRRFSGESNVRECTEYKVNLDIKRFQVIQIKAMTGQEVGKAEVRDAILARKPIVCKFCKREQDETKEI